MNSNDSAPSQSPKKNSTDPVNKQPPEPTKPPKTHPLSSPQEPTRAYPTDPSRTYSSDPSQYAYPPDKPPSEEPSKIYTTESLDTARIATNDMKASTNQSQKGRGTFEDRNQQTSHNKTNQNKVNDFYTYTISNKEPLITYILLILGLLILLFAHHLLGGLIIGMVAGYYFSSTIISNIRNLGQLMKGQDQVRYIVLASVLLGFFIAIPGIFIGAITVATFKQIMAGPYIGD